MPIVSGEYLLPRKALIVAGGENNEGHVDFGAPEFNTALGYAQIDGPFALGIFIENDQAHPQHTAPAYFGIEITTVNRSFSLCDRRHIAFLSNAIVNTTISPASIPQLGYIDGTITNIRVWAYADAPIDDFFFLVQLKISAVIPVVSPQPLIGQDLQALTQSARFLHFPTAESYFAAPGAGSGAVTQWAYTVPAGKWSILKHSFVLIDANAGAANTVAAFVQVTINGIIVRVNQVSITGNANSMPNAEIHDIDLQAGDTVKGVTVNTGAANPIMSVQATIREYQ